MIDLNINHDAEHKNVLNRMKFAMRVRSIRYVLVFQIVSDPAEEIYRFGIY